MAGGGMGAAPQSQSSMGGSGQQQGSMPATLGGMPGVASPATNQQSQPMQAGPMQGGFGQPQGGMSVYPSGIPLSPYNSDAFPTGGMQSPLAPQVMPQLKVPPPQQPPQMLGGAPGQGGFGQPQVQQRIQTTPEWEQRQLKMLEEQRQLKMSPGQQAALYGNLQGGFGQPQGGFGQPLGGMPGQFYAGPPPAQPSLQSGYQGRQMSPEERAYREQDARDQAIVTQARLDQERAYQQMTPEQREQQKQQQRQQWQRRMEQATQSFMPPGAQEFLRTMQQGGMPQQPPQTLGMPASQSPQMDQMMQKLLQMQQGGAPKPPSPFNPAPPVVSKRAQPVVSKPAQPVVSKPAQPVVSKRAQPVVSKPAQPVVSKPTQVRPEDPRMQAMRNIQQIPNRLKQ